MVVARYKSHTLFHMTPPSPGSQQTPFILMVRCLYGTRTPGLSLLPSTHKGGLGVSSEQQRVGWRLAF